MALAVSKYRNVPVQREGHRFASKAEAKRWDELRMLEKAGEITDLKRQVAFPLYGHSVDGPKLVGKYIADFCYRPHDAPFERPLIVEDVKGGAATMTDTFRLKAKLFEAQYGFPITIIGGPRRSTRSKRK